MYRGQKVPALLQVRTGYTRTDDQIGDTLRALKLAREAERAAARNVAIEQSFNDWLRANGHRFMS
jgi:hypothetical protein